MNAFLSRFLLFLTASFLIGCATSEPDQYTWSTAAHKIKPDAVDRIGNTPRALLSYYQSLAFFTPSELLHEKQMMSQYAQVPDGRLRLAMVLGHPRQPNAELKRANDLLTELLQTGEDPVIYPLQPVIRMLATSYGERLRLEQQGAKQNAQLEKQYLRLLELQRQSAALQQQSAELQGKLEGLADIERSLPQSRRR